MEEIAIKRERPFVGLLILIIGIDLVLKHLHYMDHFKWTDWPGLLIFFGAAFLIYGWVSREFDLLFPSFLLLGIGCQFYFSGRIKQWPEPATFYPLLIGIGFFIRYYKVKKSGALIGITLVVLSLYPYFSKKLETNLHQAIGTLSTYWPVLIIALGAFLFFKKK